MLEGKQYQEEPNLIGRDEKAAPYRFVNAQQPLSLMENTLHSICAFSQNMDLAANNKQQIEIAIGGRQL